MAAHFAKGSYEKQFPEAIRCLEEGLEDSLQFYRFDQIDHRKISVNVKEFFHWLGKESFHWLGKEFFHCPGKDVLHG